MVVLGHVLTANAIDFIARYERKLDRKWKVDRLPFDCKYWGDIALDEQYYTILIKTNIPGESFDAVFCHEFYHAFQFSKGFPTVLPNSRTNTDTAELAHRLTCAVLDLSTDDVLRKHSIDNSFIVMQRYKLLKDFRKGGFSICASALCRNYLTIELIIGLHGVPAEQRNVLLQELKKTLPGVFEMYNNMKEKIDEFGFSTPEGCFKIYGFLISSLDLWKHCHILYCGNQVHDLQQFQNSIAHDQRVENKLENYFANRQSSVIGIGLL